MITVSSQQVRECLPCKEGWKTFLRAVNKTKADSSRVPVETVLQTNGLKDALWVLSTVSSHKGALRLFACRCGKMLLPLWNELFPRDNRPRSAFSTAELHAQATHQAPESSLPMAHTAASAAALYAENIQSRTAAKVANYAVLATSPVEKIASAASEIGLSILENFDLFKEDVEKEFIQLIRLEGPYKGM